MKKIFILMGFLFYTISSYAQTFEYRYLGDDGYIFQVAENEFVYGIKSDSLKEVNIFSLDHTLLKTIHLIPSDSIDYLADFHLSKTLFNSDSKFELVYIWYNALGNHIKVINEDGLELLSAYHGAWFKLYNTDQGAKMLISYYPFSYVDIYSLYGTVLELSEINSNYYSLPFPNPSTDYVIIPFDLPRNERNLILSIYNINGQLVKEINVNSEDKYLKVYVSTWISGVYNYKIYNNTYSTKTKMFIVKK